jgi:hypothetical protein
MVSRYCRTVKAIDRYTVSVPRPQKSTMIMMIMIMMMMTMMMLMMLMMITMMMTTPY